MLPLWTLIVDKMLLNTLALQTKSLDYNKSTLWNKMGMKSKTSADMLPCSLYCVGVWPDNWEAKQRNDLFVSTQCQFLSLLPVHYGKWLVSVSPDVTSCRPRCVAPRDQGLARVRVRRQNKFHSVAHCPASAQLLSTSVWAVLIRINWRGNSSFYKWVPNVTFISLFKNKHFCLPCKWEKSDLKDNLMTWNVQDLFNFGNDLNLKDSPRKWYFCSFQFCSSRIWCWASLAICSLSSERFLLKLNLKVLLPQLAAPTAKNFFMSFTIKWKNPRILHNLTIRADNAAPMMQKYFQFSHFFQFSYCKCPMSMHSICISWMHAWGVANSGQINTAKVQKIKG